MRFIRYVATPLLGLILATGLLTFTGVARPAVPPTTNSQSLERPVDLLSDSLLAHFYDNKPESIGVEKYKVVFHGKTWNGVKRYSSTTTITIDGYSDFNFRGHWDSDNPVGSGYFKGDVEAFHLAFSQGHAVILLRYQDETWARFGFKWPEIKNNGSHELDTDSWLKAQKIQYQGGGTFTIVDLADNSGRPIR